MTKKSVKKSPAKKPAAKKIKIAKLRKDATIAGAAIGWQKAGSKGRGVFARRSLRKGQLIEISPVVVMGKKAIPANGDPPDGYALEWDTSKRGQEYCMPLGYVMMYNHSSKPNIALHYYYDALEIRVTALRPIKKGEELRWDYNCEVWFEEDE